MQPDLDRGRCETDWALGRWDGLEDRCRRLAGAADDPDAAPIVQLILGRLLLARGERDEALDVLSVAAARSAAAGVLNGPENGAIARALLASGRVDQAADAALPTLAAIRRKGMLLRATDVFEPCIDVLLASGEATAAVGLVAELSREVRGLERGGIHAAIQMSEALLAGAKGEPARAARHYRHAEHAWKGLPRRHDALRAMEGRGRSLLSAGADEGAEVLERALDGFEELGATWDAARVRQGLREHGISLVHRRGRKGYGTSLSPRESEVAALAADGLSNREIAERLFLSPWTVKQHVSSTLRKLGMASREDLTAQDLEPIGN